MTEVAQGRTCFGMVGVFCHDSPLCSTCPEAGECERRVVITLRSQKPTPQIMNALGEHRDRLLARRADLSMITVEPSKVEAEVGKLKRSGKLTKASAAMNDLRIAPPGPRYFGLAVDLLRRGPMTKSELLSAYSSDGVRVSTARSYAHMAWRVLTVSGLAVEVGAGRDTQLRKKQG
jgi:hypothetical protein